MNKALTPELEEALEQVFEYLSSLSKKTPLFYLARKIEEGKYVTVPPNLLLGLIITFRQALNNEKEPTQ